jgi:hypothetical protein
MNREKRKAAASMNRDYLKKMQSGTRWSQRVDPDDPDHVLIEMRIPNGGMPEAYYEGDAAHDRIKRFCKNYMDGVNSISN